MLTCWIMLDNFCDYCYFLKLFEKYVITQKNNTLFQYFSYYTHIDINKNNCSLLVVHYEMY